jgi:nicotinamidase-related amidase
MMSGIVRIINKIERLDKAIRREGTPAIIEAWEHLKPHTSLFLHSEAANGPARQDGQNGGGSGHLG